MTHWLVSEWVIPRLEPFLPLTNCTSLSPGMHCSYSNRPKSTCSCVMSQSATHCPIVGSNIIHWVYFSMSSKDYHILLFQTSSASNAVRNKMQGKVFILAERFDGCPRSPNSAAREVSILEVVSLFDRTIILHYSFCLLLVACCCVRVAAVGWEIAKNIFIG